MDQLRETIFAVVPYHQTHTPFPLTLIYGCMEPKKAEAVSLKDVLEWATQFQVRKGVVEVDSQTFDYAICSKYFAKNRSYTGVILQDCFYYMEIF